MFPASDHASCRGFPATRTHPIADSPRRNSCCKPCRPRWICARLRRLVHFNEIQQNVASPFVPSRLFIYFNERDTEGTVPQDAGAMIRDGIKSVVTLGVPPEDLWAYDDTPADPHTGLFPPGSRAAQRPPQSVYVEALNHVAVDYQAVPIDINQMKACLAMGDPFAIGSPVFPSFMSPQVAATGIIPMPGRFEQPEGGHAYDIFGYDDSTGYALLRNSWSKRWGINGYAQIPYEYLTSLGSDAWVIRTIKVPAPPIPPPPIPPAPVPVGNTLTITGRLGHVVWGDNFWGYLTK